MVEEEMLLLVEGPTETKAFPILFESNFPSLLASTIHNVPISNESPVIVVK